MKVHISQQIMTLKDRIKALAVDQKKAKRARKRIPKLEYDAIKKELAPDKEFWSAQWDVIKRKSLVTACLNLYHEVRESEYRHNVSKDDYYYNSYMKELRAELKLEEKEPEAA